MPNGTMGEKCQVYSSGDSAFSWDEAGGSMSNVLLLWRLDLWEPFKKSQAGTVPFFLESFKGDDAPENRKLKDLIGETEASISAASY